jgi:DNA invertase Pin-like site-specific DNA recombinase
MTRYGYTRVSTPEQNTASQYSLLTEIQRSAR